VKQGVCLPRIKRDDTALRDTYHSTPRRERLSLIRRSPAGIAAVNAATVSKSHRTNMFEGIALTAVFQAFPVLTMSALALKLEGRSHLVTDPGGAAIFVVLASISSAASIAFLAPKFPKYFARQYQPSFFDPGLSLSEKILRWRSQPERPSQLVALVMMLSVLAVVVMSVR
jgi:hypothetical protein